MTLHVKAARTCVLSAAIKNECNVRWGLKERRLDKHGELPDMVGSLMNGAREITKKQRGETTLHPAVLGLLCTLAILTGLRRPLHSLLHGLASIHLWVLSVGRSVTLQSPAHSFNMVQA